MVEIGWKWDWILTIKSKKEKKGVNFQIVLCRQEEMLNLRIKNITKHFQADYFINMVQKNFKIWKVKQVNDEIIEYVTYHNNKRLIVKFPWDVWRSNVIITVYSIPHFTIRYIIQTKIVTTWRHTIYRKCYYKRKHINENLIKMTFHKSQYGFYK